MDSRTMNYLMKHPDKLLKFQMTGKAPQLSHKAQSPLITLLESIPLRDRLRIQNVTVDSSVGYTGSRQFRNAELALKWVKPDYACSSWPAESWRDKRFNKRLTIADLKAKAKIWPNNIPA